MQHTVNANEIVITAANAANFVNPTVAGERKVCGTVPRPPEFRSAFISPPAAVTMPLIPESEWADRIREKVAAKSQISDVWKRQGVPILDQNGKGFCWAHSGTSATQALRALANLPTVPLSAYAVACVIKNYRDEGGWGAQGLDFISDRGVPSAEFWPMQSMSRANDNPQTWANAALHKVTEGWVDLQAPQYDRQLSRAQVATCLLNNIPVIADFNWWSHSVMLADLVILPNGKIGTRLGNSWGPTWSDGGFGVLDESKAWPDGAVAPRGTVASAA